MAPLSLGKDFPYTEALAVRVSVSSTLCLQQSVRSLEGALYLRLSSTSVDERLLRNKIQCTVGRR